MKLERLEESPERIFYNPGSAVVAATMLFVDFTQVGQDNLEEYLDDPFHPLSGPEYAFNQIKGAFDVISGFFGSKPDPEAWLALNRTEDGSIGYGVNANETGGGLTEFVEQQGNPIVDLLTGLESRLVGLPGGQFNIDHLPALHLLTADNGKAAPQWSLHGGHGLGNAVTIF